MIGFGTDVPEFEPDLPKWEQVYIELRKRIEAGIYRERHPIPSIRQLMQVFGVSDGTIQKALNRLKAEQFVRARHGHGTFVRPSDFWSPPEEED